MKDEDKSLSFYSCMYVYVYVCVCVCVCVFNIYIYIYIYILYTVAYIQSTKEHFLLGLNIQALKIYAFLLTTKIHLRVKCE